MSALYILSSMTKRLVDIDDEVLNIARGRLGTATIKDTVGEALRLATVDRDAEIERALATLAGTAIVDRSDAWR
jgi:Arc/MetJ family transcription regulator